MLYLPDPVVNFLHTFTIESRSPAYLLVMKDGRLSRWGGNLTLYGLTNLQQGEYVEQQILFLTGLLPLNGAPINLPCVEMESGISADVHIFSAKEGDWVILLDATLFESQRSLVQQKGNDLSLIRNKQARSLNQYINRYDTENLSQGFLRLLERGERRDVTILLARICGLTSYIDNHSPEEIFLALKSYFSTIVQSVLDQGGMVDKISGDVAIALFGILPATGSPCERAITAALCMIEAVGEVGIWQKDKRCTFETGIGIASGRVALGIIGSKNNKTLIAVGHHVKLAEQLGNQARPREILIDENTFNQLGEMQKYFSTSTLLDTQIIEPLRYSYQVK